MVPISSCGMKDWSLASVVVGRNGNFTVVLNLPEVYDP